jgi:glycosyltransferase involved in cell wall biosynthesis
LAAADLEVHDIQGFGLGIGSLEPIDAGIPIIAYVRNNNLDGPDIHEICSDGFIDSNDAKTLSSAISEVLTDSNVRQRVLSGQRCLLEQVYYSDVVAERYVQEFEKYLKN